MGELQCKDNDAAQRHRIDKFLELFNSGDWNTCTYLYDGMDIDDKRCIVNLIANRLCRTLGRSAILTAGLVSLGGRLMEEFSISFKFVRAIRYDYSLSVEWLGIESLGGTIEKLERAVTTLYSRLIAHQNSEMSLLPK